MCTPEVSKSGDAPWIIAVQRQLVGGAVVTKEVLRSQDGGKLRSHRNMGIYGIYPEDSRHGKNDLFINDLVLKMVIVHSYV
jgi:hypothetical protein